jgi:hypothetical protein
MLRLLFSALLLTLASAAAAAPPIDLVTEFDQFATRTAAQPEAERVAAFRAEFGPKLTGIYSGEEGSSDKRIARALAAWPGKRIAVLAARDRVTKAYADGTRNFAKAFPSYQPVMPVYVINSFGGMDGGTRDVNGHEVLIFGADMIGELHAQERIEPFLNHELFHTYHSNFFTPGCVSVWCQLWVEGLAVYVSSRMTLGATDSELLLIYPRPLRPEVDARMAEAVCGTLHDLDVKDDATTSLYFNGGGPDGAFPRRFGYYLGYRVAERIGKTMTLDQMAHMPAAKVRPRIEAELRAMAPCPA